MFSVLSFFRDSNLTRNIQRVRHREFFQESLESHPIAGRGEHRNRLPDHFLRCVPVNLLGAFVPVSNDAIEILANDGILRGIYDQGQAVLGVAELASLSAIKLLIRVAQFLFYSLSITDISYRANNNETTVNGNRVRLISTGIPSRRAACRKGLSSDSMRRILGC